MRLVQCRHASGDAVGKTSQQVLSVVSELGETKRLWQCCRMSRHCSNLHQSHLLRTAVHTLLITRMHDTSNWKDV